MKFKRIISMVTALSIVLSAFSALVVTTSAQDSVYTCDFAQLVKNGADTIYGTETDIYQLDEYTKAYLTYEGTYISADGEVYLKGPNSGKAGSVKGSYIEFCAPSAGTVTFTANAFNYFIDGAYTSYNKGTATMNVDLQSGQVIQIAQRIDGTYISALSFTPAPEATPTPTPTAAPDINDYEPDREVIYQENFESYSDGANGGWTSPAGTVAVKTDSDLLINKYLTVTSGKSGTARSGYKEISAISENFVLEADIKSTAYASNVSAFEVLENKGSLYMNHGCYSNAKYVFKMNRPSGLNKYVINNTISDSGMTLDRYAQPPVVTKDIPNEWLHVKVIGDFDNHTVTAYITSLDRQTVYYHGRTDMSADISSFALIALLAPSSGVDTCIDNIKISKALDSDLREVFYTVTINDGISGFSQYVYTGESVTNIPDVSVYGDYFLGWDINGVLKSTAELTSFPIAENVSITAKVSPDYIEKLASVEFNSFPSENMLVMGADGDTFADNIISLTITGERGTSIVSNPDSRVDDYKIEWQFDGFRTLDGTPTGEGGTFPGTQLYCDSYGRVTVDEAAQSMVNFELKNTAADYYGMVTAKVTYNGITMTASRPLVLLADAGNSGDILPKAGYTADYNKYEDSLVGYTASQNDILLGGWSAAGSDGSYIKLAADTSGKYLSLSRALTGNSSYIYQTAGDISSQTVFAQDIRFGMGGTVAYGTGKAVTELSSTAFELGFSSSGFTLNGSAVCTAETGKWYHVEITADPTTRLCYAKIYNLKSDGNYSGETPIGTTEAVSFNSSYTTGNYYRISLAKERGSVDINNVCIKAAEVDKESVMLTVPEKVSIPESGTATTELTVSAKTADGGDFIGMAEWEIADEFASGVAIISTGADSAALTVDSTASSGDVNVKITLGGTSVIKTVRLIGTRDNVAFVNAPLSVLIPDSGSSEALYTAVVRDGDANDISGRAVTYALYDEANSAPFSSSGISINANGVLTVTSGVQPATICIRANSVDSSGNEITRAVKVNIYNLSFTFGTNTYADCTTVTASEQFSANKGFGIEGTVTANEAYISGSGFGFKVQLEAGEVYSVTAKYVGTIVCEKINSDLAGFTRTKDSLAEDSFNVAVVGEGVLDITFSGEGTLASLSIEKVERTANEKPAWWTIGDSTIQQNGSWAYTITNDSTTDLSKYPALDGVISSFHNSGRAGRQHRSYYTEGLFNNVLCGIREGDVVSISGMGTNDSSSSKQDFKEYNNIYIDAIEAMGARVILGSYTPSGNYGATEGRVYDADNIAFKGARGNSYDVAIREVYAERVAAGDDKILGFIDIGKIADNLMTNDVRTAYNAAAQAGMDKNEARAAAQAKADELMAMWKDYNHYYVDFSNYILPEITARAAQLIQGEEQSVLPEVIELNVAKEPEIPNSINVLSTAFENGEIVITIDSGFTGVAIAAMYGADGALLEVLIEEDNSKSRAFEFEVTAEVSGGVIRLMNWNSLKAMKPIGKPIEIMADDIGGVITPDSTIEITSEEEYIDV